MLASFPGLPTVQFLIACSFCILQAIKNWTVGRPGNEAKLAYGVRLLRADGKTNCFVMSLFGDRDHLRYHNVICWNE